MDEFGCDYACRTVGESITKYNIPIDHIGDLVKAMETRIDQEHLAENDHSFAGDLL